MCRSILRFAIEAHLVLANVEKLFAKTLDFLAGMLFIQSTIVVNGVGGAAGIVNSPAQCREPVPRFGRFRILLQYSSDIGNSSTVVFHSFKHPASQKKASTAIPHSFQRCIQLR